MIKRQVLLITKATLFCVHGGLQTSEARPGFDETLVYLTHTTTPNRVEKGTSKELLQWMQVYPAILQVFPCYICFLFYPVWCCSACKENNSTIWFLHWTYSHLHEDCWRVACSVFAFKVWNLVFKFFRFEYFITDWCKFAFAFSNQLSFSNLTLSMKM